MIPTTIYQAFSRPFPRDRRSNLREFLHAHQVDLDNRDENLEYVKRSHNITEASGKDLELIGRRFGKLGQRQGRGDEIYRKYLSGLNSAFSGRGTKSDVRYAFASGVFAQTDDNISIQEDVANHEYSITISDWQKHTTSLIEEYSDFAEPSGVELAFPISYVLESGEVEIRGSEAGSNPSIQYPVASLQVEGGETTGTIVNDDGLGSDILGAGDVLGPGDTSDSYYEGDIQSGTTETIPDDELLILDSPLGIGGELAVGGEAEVRDFDV